MPRRSRLSMFPVFLAPLIAIATWPVFVACATAIGYVGGEAWQLDAWAEEPKRRLLQFFLDGWTHSIPIAIGVGLLAAVDWLLLARMRYISLIAGILLPIAGAVASFALASFTPWNTPMALFPTLVATGVALAIIYRLCDVARRVID